MNEPVANKNPSKIFLRIISYFFKIVLVTATAMLVGGMNLTLGLLFAGLFTLLYLLFSKQKTGAYFTPNFLFIPLIYRFLHTIDFSLYPNDYQNALGQLVVAFWVAGIIHILLSMIVRYVPYRLLRRFFPPYLIGALVIALALIFIILISGQYIFVPLYENTAIDFIDIITIAATIFIAMMIKTNLSQGNFFRDGYILFAIIGGGLTHLLLEITAFGTGIVAGNLYLLDIFNSNTVINYSTITPLINYENTFGFIDNLNLNWNMIIAIMPITIIAFFELFEAVKDNRRLVFQSDLAPQDYDRLIFSNGVSIMLGSTCGLSPFYAQKVHDQRMNKRSELIALLIAITLIILLSPWTWFTNLFLLIPPGVYYGIIIFAFLIVIGHGYEMIKVSLNEQKHWKNIVVAIAAGGSAIFFGLFDVISEWTGLNFLSLQIGAIKLDYLLIGLVVGIIINIIIPRKFLHKNKSPIEK